MRLKFVDHKDLTISIISHGHGEMIWNLVDKLTQLESVSKIIVTLNIAETVPPNLPDSVMVIQNSSQMGFGENHNQAFKKCQTEFFGVINPDIELLEDPFPELLKTLAENHIGVVGPRVLDYHGEDEDSLREFPTPIRLFKRYMFCRHRSNTFTTYGDIMISEWIAGMFMIFKSQDYQEIAGFNTNYFLYCEDVEICTRLWRSRKWVAVNPNAKVIHKARRASRSSLRHFYWHTTSLIRYWATNMARLPKISAVMSRSE